MDKMKLIVSAIAAVFAVLTLTKTLSFDITARIMYVCLGIACLIDGAEGLKAGKKGSAIFNFILGAAFIVLEFIRLLDVL